MDLYTMLLNTAYRVRPSDSPSAWELNRKTIKLGSNAGKAPQEFNFDEILTGSENKPVYNAVARSHVCAAMDGMLRSGLQRSMHSPEYH